MERDDRYLIANIVAALLVGVGLLFRYDSIGALGLGLIIGSSVVWK